MKKDIIYLTLIILLVAFNLKAKPQQTTYFYYEESVRHGLHYGIWSNINQTNGPFVVRCIEVDSTQSKNLKK